MKTGSFYLDSKKHYLQIALNSSLNEAERIIKSLPPSDRIIIEAGTPLIKRYGTDSIRHLRSMWQSRIIFDGIKPYVVADMKCMDRGETEVKIAAEAGASAVVALGQAPIETQNAFIAACIEHSLDSMIDMMNVEKPYQVLRKLKVQPTVVILHRGVDEEKYSDKPLPIHMINKVKGSYNVLVSIAGGDTSREIQSSVFNGADIVVVWKHFYDATSDTGQLAVDFLTKIK